MNDLLDTNVCIVYLNFPNTPIDLAKLGRPIGPYDLQIAAIALAHDLTLITHNTREFSRIPSLKLEDWELP